MGEILSYSICLKAEYFNEKNAHTKHINMQNGKFDFEKKPKFPSKKMYMNALKNVLTLFFLMFFYCF